MLCAGTAVFLFMNSAFSAALFPIDNTTSDNKDSTNTLQFRASLASDQLPILTT
eukprot:COSAG02_NODE_37300_length_443_cov_3.534884_1_plen_53_part_10